MILAIFWGVIALQSKVFCSPSPTQIVYTGINLHHISDLNLDEFTYTLDFDVWFRYQGDLAVEQIQFLNAREAIQFSSKNAIETLSSNAVPELHQGILIAKQDIDNKHYRLYRVKGRFTLDFLSGFPIFFREHLLGLSFRHQWLPRAQLQYAVDPIFLEQTNVRDFWEKVKQTHILSAASEWKIEGGQFFEDEIEQIPLMNLITLPPQHFTERYSRFNAAIWIKRDDFSLRGIISAVQALIPPSALTSVFFVSGFLILLLVAISHLAVFKRFPKFFWCLQALAMSLFLLTSEGFLVNTLVHNTIDAYYLKLLILFFDVLWWLLGAFLFVLAIDRFVWMPLRKHTQRPVSRLLRHSVAVSIYLLAFFGIVAFVFGQKVSSLIATSGIFALILAFSNKIDISNVFAGIGISLSNPFRIGDWVKIGDCEEGQVVDMTSRTTNIQTRDYSMLSIPNTTVAAAVIENFNYPDARFRVQCKLETEPIYHPARVQKVLRDAVLSTDGVLREPGPEILFQGQGDSSAIYTVVFYIDDYGQKHSLKQAVWKRVWIHLKQAGIGLATPRREILVVRPVVDEMSDPLRVLQQVELFAPLDEDDKITLSQHTQKHRFPAGETLVRQGESERKSLFILLEGAVGLWVQSDDGTPIEVARLGAGDVFGEMELFTGKARGFGAIAITETEAYEISKEDIAPFLHKHPELAERFSQKLTERQMTIAVRKDILQTAQVDTTTLSSQILENIERFFGLKETS